MSEKQAGGKLNVKSENVEHFDFVSFPTKVAIQLSDPSAGIAVIELLRILIDEEGLSFT